MKENETDYLDKLFASSSDVTDQAEVDFPLVDVPENLSNKLHAIAESASISTTPANAARVKRRVFKHWPAVTSVAASLFVAVMGFQFYQQQQTLKQLEQAQADLATALHYLGEANRITRAQVGNSLKDNMKKAGVEPALEIGRDSVLPNLKELEHETKTRNRTL